jgi:hypothetical protein
MNVTTGVLDKNCWRVKTHELCNRYKLPEGQNDFLHFFCHNFHVSWLIFVKLIVEDLPRNATDELRVLRKSMQYTPYLTTGRKGKCSLVFLLEFSKIWYSLESLYIIVLIDASPLKVWIEKAVHINVSDVHLQVYHKTVWHFENEEHVDEACVLFNP